MKGNSLVLHFASLTVHKVTVIFTDRLKRDKEGLFCSLNAFDSDYHNSTLLKGVSLKTRLSPLAQYDYLKP